MKETKVLRVSLQTYEELKEAKQVAGQTFSELLLDLVESYKALKEAQRLYAVENQLYADLASARGEAILRAVEQSRPPELPDVLVLLGKDTGASLD